MSKVVSVGAQFQREMSNVKAFVGGTATDFQNLSDKAEALGASTAFTASQAAQAMAEMSKAGLSANQILGASEGVLTLAAAGDIEMAEAATIAAAALNQFQIPATQMPTVVDQLAKASSSGAITLSGMGTQLSYAASSATAFGLDLGETAGMIATLATTLGEDKAGTAFRAMMTSLQAPSAGARAAMDDLGVSVTDAAGNFLEPANVISQFSSALDGMSAGHKAAKLNQIFNSRGLPAFTTFLKQGSQGMRDMNEAILASDGFGLETAKTKLDNVAGGFDELKSAVEALEIKIFQTFQGPLQKSLEGTADFIRNSMIPTFKQSIEWLGAFADVAEFAWNNFGTIGEIAVKQVALSVHSIANDIAHFFVTDMGQITSWMFDNWSSIWRDMAAATRGVLGNIGQNVRNVFSAVWETVSTLGETPLTFDMIPLMDGIKTTTKALELQPRVASQLEADLAMQISSAKGNLGQNFDSFLNSVTKGIGDTAATVSAESGAANMAADVAIPQDTDSDASGDVDSSVNPLKIALKGSREAFETINKAIKGVRDAPMKTVAKESEKQTKLLEKTVDLIDGIPDAFQTTEVFSLA